jgi:hypothetical protein
MKKISLLLSFLLLTALISAQTVAIGDWQEHLSYKNAISVTEGNGLVYCATASGVFFFRKTDNSMTRLSKVNSLSDVEATVVKFNAYNNKVIVTYKNSNLDIIENSNVINISDIKRKSIVGNKLINNITFINQYAYLSCGFGIVVIDMDRDEVKDTYYMGPGGSTINVRDITSDGTFIYAATDGGIYKAAVSNPNLANYSSWTLINNAGPGIHIPIGIYNTIAAFNGKIYTNYSANIMSGAYAQDTIFEYDGTSWSHFAPLFSGYNAYRITNNFNTLVIVLEGVVYTFDPTFTSVGYFSGYFADATRAKDAVVDNAGALWIADSKYGLVSWLPGIGYIQRYPNGPGSEKAVNMSLNGDVLYVAPGGVNATWQNLGFADGLYAYANDNWSNINVNSPVIHLDTTIDIMNVLVDSSDTKRVYATTWKEGVIEFYDGVPIQAFNNTNSSLSVVDPITFPVVWTYGLAFDAKRNLWISNSLVSKSISVKKANGTWQNFDFSPILGSGPYLGQVLVDRYDQKWVVITRGGGLMVTNIGTSATTINATNSKKLSTSPGNGALPSTGVECLANDLSGEIWVGTDKGICVFYSPENVFNGSNFDAQQILLEQDGHVQILLETEDVQAIAVDDANRKWIGTANSGVFLMSADGTKQIEHFDETNSPLFSNNIKSIVINHKTGEVYFGTTKGIISYRGTSTEAFENFTDVYAFPNPVKHDYTGPIAIKGLVNNSILKITDISGSLVYETKSEGGQAIWYGTNFKGERVSSGVYMVFCASEDGTKKFVTKILLIN